MKLVKTLLDWYLNKNLWKQSDFYVNSILLFWFLNHWDKKALIINLWNFFFFFDLFLFIFTTIILLFYFLIDESSLLFLLLMILENLLLLTNIP